MNAAFHLLTAIRFAPRTPATYSSTPTRLMALAKGQTLRIERPLHCRIECVEGDLWLTHDCDRRDIVLADGQAHVADRKTRLLVHALRDARVRVSSTAISGLELP